MGNIQSAAWGMVYNIAPDGNNEGAAERNDPNLPYSKQMFGAVAHGMIPFISVCFLAYTANKHKAETNRLTERCVTLQKENNDLRTNEPLYHPSFDHRISRQDLSLLLEGAEELAAADAAPLLAELRYYDKRIEDIEDIACSVLKKRGRRVALQENLITRLITGDSALKELDVYNGLKDIFKYDYLFCGQNKKDNGKLRQLYLKNWRLQIELRRNRQVLNAIRGTLQNNQDF